MRRPSQSHPDARFRREFLVAAGAFVFAGGVGAWIRFAQFYGGFGPLNFPDVRHAHSHLMLFSWAIPGVLICLAQRFSEEHTLAFRRVIRAAIGLGILSFFPFAFWGYRPALIAGFRLPLSIIISTFIIFVWYAAAQVYWRRSGALADAERGVWDVVMSSLVLCTIGAWMRGVFTGLKMGETIWAHAAVQGFLTILTDGVLLVGVVAAMSSNSARVPNSARRLMALGIPLSFLAYLDVPDAPRTIGLVSSVVFLSGAGIAVASVRTVAIKARFAALLIILARIFYVLPPISSALNESGVRIFALHWIFLAVVSMALLELQHVSSRKTILFGAAVVMLLLGILPTTSWWPAGYPNAGIALCVVTSTLPSMAMLVILVASKFEKQAII